MPQNPKNGWGIRHDHRIERISFRQDEEHSQDWLCHKGKEHGQDSSHAKCASDGAEVAVPQRDQILGVALDQFQSSGWATSLALTGFHSM
jgi:hypothetical protein